MLVFLITVAVCLLSLFALIFSLGQILLKTVIHTESEVVVVGERSQSDPVNGIKTTTKQIFEPSDVQSKETRTRRQRVNKTNDYDQIVTMAGKSEEKDFSNPVYKKISLKNGEINRLNRTQLSERLSELSLDKDGSKEVLRKRLKAHIKKEMLTHAGLEGDDNEEKTAVKCPFDYILVIDFEATCERENSDEYIHEIIEFPAILLNTRTLKVEDEFHAFCQPVLHPTLSTFCTELTGITQAQVDAADTFQEVFKKFEDWLSEKKLGEKFTFSILTDGPWDIVCFLNVQCALSEIPFPDYARKYINIRNMYSNFYHTRRLKLCRMLEVLGMTFQGREHSGLADARNITRILVRLLQDGCYVRTNATFDPSSNSVKERKHFKENLDRKTKTSKSSKSKNQEVTSSTT